MKTALVLGAGGFIGGHLVKRLKAEGYWVRGAVRSVPAELPADEYMKLDLRERMSPWEALSQPFDEVYQLAADMGGAGYTFGGEHDADIMRNSQCINLNLLDVAKHGQIACGRIFYASSACVYGNEGCAEDSAYPAQPESEYGWEKLFSERLYLAHARDYGLNVRIGRLHTIFGHGCAWQGGKEKALAALCRKVALAMPLDVIDVWGDGEQTRSFLYIDEALEGITRLTRSDFAGPVNIGSSEQVTINQLVRMIADIAGKNIEINHIPGPQGVRGRNSDNRLIQERLGWAPSERLIVGLEKTYLWIADQVKRA